MRRALLFLTLALPLSAVTFRAQQIGSDLGVVYAVAVHDMNGDGKPDIVAVLPTKVVWYENPQWTPHIVLDGKTEKDNVCLAIHDIDGDGKPDIALGASWQPSNTKSGGTLQWLRNTGNGEWPLFPISEEPTLHRIRFGDVDGDGRKELVVVPLHGRGTRGPDWQGQGLQVLVFRIPANPKDDPWPVETADDSLHIGHNFIVEDYDGDKRREIWTASREGVHVLQGGPAGNWKLYKIGEGSPGEIKLGRVNRRRVLATVEPWHGNGVIIYEEPNPPLTPQGPPPKPDYRSPLGTIWPNQMIEERLASGHALGWGDFDGDGSDELAVGWREKNFGIAMYKKMPGGKWARLMTVDDGGMATEDLVVADLDGDGRPDIVGGGRATKNVRIYWNTTEPEWKRHVISTAAKYLTAVAADFTGDGKVDVIGAGNGDTVLYVAPDWKPVVVLKGVNAIHSAVLDVNRDGRMDFVGARYSPGYVFWLECPKDPLREPWPLHVIDDKGQAGIDGIHGLFVADINRDGIPDLIANSAQPRSPFPNSLVWFDMKTGKRNVFAKEDAPGLSHYMGAGDINGDGRPDIASGAKMPGEGNWFAWWEQPSNPSRPWKKHLIAEKQDGATNILIADVNGDGKNDFFATRGHGVGAVWYEAPAWTPHEANLSLVGPHSLAAADIDGDGKIDFATVAKDSHIAAWFQNDGKGGFTTRHIYEDQAAYDVRLLDMNGDGKPDLLVAGQESNNLVWYENRTERPWQAAQKLPLRSK